VYEIEERERKSPGEKWRKSIACEKFRKRYCVRILRKRISERNKERKRR
jgi:hypothetical protein